MTITIPTDRYFRGYVSPEALRPHYVYRCFDAEGRLLYVGCTVNPKDRIAQHRDTAWWGDRIASARMTVFPHRDYALAKEREAIFAERPVCNVKGRWHRHDPREDWTLDDYLTLRSAVVAAANGIVGAGTTRLLARIDREVAERFEVAS